MIKKINVFFHSTSDDETHCIERYFGPVSVHQIENVPSLVTEPLNPSKKEKGNLKAVFISRIVKKKNLLFAIKLINDLGEGASLDIYGSIEDKQYWELCKSEMNKNKYNAIRYKGELQHNEVYAQFANHDVFLFPSFSENYGHVIVESLQCGCPVILSNQTPWNDVGQMKVGGAYSLDNYDKFIEILLCLKNLSSNDYEKIRERCKKYILEHLQVSSLKEKYKNMIEDIIGSF